MLLESIVVACGEGLVDLLLRVLSALIGLS